MSKTNTHQNNAVDMQTDYCGTTYAAKLLGLSVGTIQTLVEKNELHAWKTHGGHRRISLDSVREYQIKYNQNVQTKEVNKNNRLRVLLVEDDAVTREMLLGFCESEHLPIDCTAMASGMEALIDIASFRPDVLITDLAMPGVDGFELLRTLRQNPLFDRMAILALTALTADEIQSKGGLPEGSMYKEKPVKAEWFDGFFAGIKVGAFDLQKTNTDKNTD